MINYEVLCETEDYVAINKPAGLLTIPDRHDPEQFSLINLLRTRFGDMFVVHRLDKFTSGAILFAKNAHAHRYFSLLFENRNIQKEYIGILEGRLTEPAGTIEAAIAESKFHKGEMVINSKGKPSITDYEVLNDFSLYSVVLFRPRTGRTHQIRVHAKYINHPLVCDSVYGKGTPVLLSSFKKRFRLSKNELEEKPLIDRLALHASSVSFRDEHGNDVRIEAPVPKDMRALIQQLKKNLQETVVNISGSVAG